MTFSFLSFFLSFFCFCFELMLFYFVQRMWNVDLYAILSDIPLTFACAWTLTVLFLSNLLWWYTRQNPTLCCVYEWPWPSLCLHFDYQQSLSFSPITLPQPPSTWWVQETQEALECRKPGNYFPAKPSYHNKFLNKKTKCSNVSYSPCLQVFFEVISFT